MGNRRRYHDSFSHTTEPLMLLMCSTVCVRTASGVGRLSIYFGCEMNERTKNVNILNKHQKKKLPLKVFYNLLN